MLTKQHQYRIKTASKLRQSFFAFHSASLQNFHVTPQLHLVQVMFFSMRVSSVIAMPANTDKYRWSVLSLEKIV